MKCAYCGAEADRRKIYCLICGTKLPLEKEKTHKSVSIEFKQNIPVETATVVPPRMKTEFPRTQAALEEIFGPEEDWAPPPVGASPDADEVWDFPVTPCDNWPAEEETAEENPFPVYTTAPLRQDVMPVEAPAQGISTTPGAPAAENALTLPVGRSLVKMILLGLVTLGIYPTVIWSRIVTELNITASRRDGKRTVSYFGMLILAPVTLSVFPVVWMHRFCKRVGNQLETRDCGFRFGAKDFWLWGVLGSLILVGPFIFTHKLMKSMNLINGSYNTLGW